MMDVSRLRASGLASGMDIDDIVKQLMNANRIPLEKLKQQKQIMEWQREEYREMNKLIYDLRNTAFDMKLQQKYIAKSASTASTAFTVTANSNAVEGVYSLKVEQLAKAASVKSSEAIDAKNIDFSEYAGSTITIAGSKGTASVTIDAQDTIETFVKKINNLSSSIGVKASYDAGLDRLFFTTTSTGQSSSFTITSSKPELLDALKLSTTTTTKPTLTGSQLFQDVTDKIDADLTEAQTFRFTYDGKTYEYTINQDTTVGQLISSINQSEAAKNGITAYLDDSGKLAFILPEASNIEFDDGTPDGSGVLAKLGLQVSYQSGDYIDKTYQEVKANGTDAKVKFNVAGDGEPIEASYSSNTFTINGMTFTLKSTSTAPEEIAVAHDVQAVFDSIKGFVDKYNEIIDKINSKLSEERYRSYAPLTDEQRKEMSEKEIELWEARAKSGLIRRDQTLESALIQFRNAFSSMVSGLPSGSVSQLHQIGITTGEWSERGKLHIDEAKLKQALTDDPEQVMRLFTADDGDDKSTNGDGIANRIYQVADTFYKRIVEKAGSAATTVLDNYAIGKNIKDIDERIENMNRRLISLEERYYRQFTAMETALSKMNAQAAYLLQQFGGA